ncbi:cysteine proteinase [Leucogyrophana mollusca]|uniref:Cysteine proteinase n=1 Tax=Leucogyrophana mollusca TaxID=85980 RepID=A0ACB8B5E6_9AGAM|nr:cysteine proteinase [Leucogyrophana mollusca]
MVAGPSEPRRRSTRNSAAQTNRPSPSVEPDELILVYPPTGTGALNIMRTDVNRLQPGEFLNDTLIEFGLKLWLNELREKDPVFADQIHVFSSFFYKKLHNKKSPEDGYQSVKKWTSKFDLFSKKYIIVPINEK